jgi:hypothetical protein
MDFWARSKYSNVSDLSKTVSSHLDGPPEHLKLRDAHTISTVIQDVRFVSQRPKYPPP